MAESRGCRKRSCLIASSAVLATLAVLTWLLVVELHRRAAVAGCKGHIYEIAYAFAKYSDTYGSLPPAIVHKNGVPMHSWRVLILKRWLPNLYAQYRLSEPWNSPHNSKLASQMPHQYRCSIVADSIPEFHTTYVTAVGPKTMLRTDKYESRRQADVPKDTIMLLELPGKPRHWMSPEDASPEEVAAYFRSVSESPGRHDKYVTADGRTRKMSMLSLQELMQRMSIAPDDLPSAPGY